MKLDTEYRCASLQETNSTMNKVIEFEMLFVVGFFFSIKSPSREDTKSIQ